MKGGKPNEPENKALLRLAEFNAARGITKTKKAAKPKNKKASSKTTNKKS